MKKHYLWRIPAVFLLFSLSGCSAIGAKATSISIIYAVAATISLLLLIGYLYLIPKKNKWFLILFSSVFVVNIGYTLLATSNGLGAALMANRLSYLGSVFLPLSMLMIILSLTHTKYSPWISRCLIGLALIVFLIAASPGILDIYYKEVSFEVVNGVSTLIKVYGPLHPIYLFYLIGYFSSMVTVIIHASLKKTISSTSYAVIVAIAVFVNIGVWLIEQLTHINFEFLSVSYIISELFLLGAHLVMDENQRLKEEIEQRVANLTAQKSDKKTTSTEAVTNEAKEYFSNGLATLTPTEKLIFNAYIAGSTTKEIMAELEITENTLKFHNKNLYSKLGVSSRKQLILVYKSINE